MNLRDLQYLVALADHKHFGRAAESCFVSQPALSMQIKKLEDFLGVQLIERTQKSFMMTEIGLVIAQQAREILLKTQALRELAKQAKNPYAGSFSLGIIPTLAPYVLPHIISGMAEHFQELSIYLIEAQTSQLLEQLKQGKLDAAFLILPINEKELSQIPLFEEEFLLAVPLKHPLAKRKLVSSENIENKTLLLLEEGHCMRDQALALCYSNKAHEDKTFQATSIETLRHMVASNRGITLMPGLACRPDDGICYIPFKLPPKRIVALVWRKTNARMKLMTAVAELVKKLMAKKKLVKVVDE